MGKLVSYDDHCRILGDNASIELIACVYCVCRIDEAEGLAFPFLPAKQELGVCLSYGTIFQDHVQYRPF